MSSNGKGPENTPGPIFLDIDELAEEFVAKKNARVHSCKVCESEYCQLIEELLLRGGGGNAIAVFMYEKLGYQISGSTIMAHVRLGHLVA